jgi:hypothetical protein
MVMSEHLIVSLPGVKVGIQGGRRWKVAVMLFPWIVLLASWSAFATYMAKRIGPEASLGVVFLVTAWACVGAFVISCAAISRSLFVYGLNPELLDQLEGADTVSWSIFLGLDATVFLICRIVAKFGYGL